MDLTKWGLSPSDLGALSSFDLPSLAVQPMLRALRHVNTAADSLFYDVNLLWLRLYTRGITVTTNMAQKGAAAENSVAALEAAARFMNLSALANPEGAILVIDAHRAPFVYKYSDVEEFLAHGLKFPTAADSEALRVCAEGCGCDRRHRSRQFGARVGGFRLEHLGSHAQTCRRNRARIRACGHRSAGVVRLVRIWRS